MAAGHGLAREGQARDVRDRQLRLDRAAADDDVLGLPVTVLGPGPESEKLCRSGEPAGRGQRRLVPVPPEAVLDEARHTSQAAACPARRRDRVEDLERGLGQAPGLAGQVRTSALCPGPPTA